MTLAPDARFTRFLLLSGVLHALLLSLTFVAPPKQPAVRRDDTLQVILVNARNAERPPQAQWHAQTDLDGGGESTQPALPTAPLPPVATEEASAPPVVAQRAAAPAPVDSAQEPATHDAGTPTPPQLTQRQAPHKTPERKPSPKAQKPAEAERQPRPAAEPTPEVRGVDLLNAAATIAQLQAKIAEETRAIAERPRVRHIGVSTQSHPYALYLEAWRQKVERVGTLNYPSEARGKIYGSLILQVALNAKGEVVETQIIRSSGHPILDEAAKKIVRLASPFARFPPEIAQETDILVITRRWTFTRNQKLTSE